MGRKLESSFQGDFIKALEETFPDSIVLKNDPNYIQGIPDVTMLYGSRYFAFECKRSKDESRQPNQEWYVRHINKMGGYACFVYPENMEEIINDISQASRVF
jgi:hypothetical protein